MKITTEMAPVHNLARRVVEKYSPTVPVDVKSLVEMYAELAFESIPIGGVDGISLNLKVPGKATRVIVEKNAPPTRQRFTLAHELGHILIPWHVGTIVDQIDPDLADMSSDYWRMEIEANTFAAELLMPHSWIEKLIGDISDLAELHRAISETCDVSAESAGIRLTQFLPENIVYASERNGVVEFSGRTEGTLAGKLNRGDSFPYEVFDYSERHYVSEIHRSRLHWWLLPSSIQPDVDVTDDRSWREILDAILLDIGIPAYEIPSVKVSINGVIGYANSECKRRNKYDAGSIVSACMQRFHDRDKFALFVQHVDFDIFLYKRAQDLTNRNRWC